MKKTDLTGARKRPNGLCCRQTLCDTIANMTTHIFPHGHMEMVTKEMSAGGSHIGSKKNVVVTFTLEGEK